MRRCELFVIFASCNVIFLRHTGVCDMFEKRGHIYLKGNFIFFLFYRYTCFIHFVTLKA